MSFLMRQLLAAIAIPLILALLPLSSGLILAQEPSPFEISIIPQAEFATAGQPFTYTVTIANVGQSSLKNIMVRVPVPEGSSLVNTYFDHPDWLVGGAQRGETGDVIWLTQEPVAPNQTMTFEMVVNVLSQIGEQLVIEDYAVILIENQDVLASGPPITIEVLAPSTSRPPTLPTATAVPVLPAPTTTSTPTSISKVDLSSPTEVAAASVAQPEQNPTDVPASSPSPTQADASETGSTLLIVVLAGIGLTILVLIILGLVRLFRSP